MRSIELSELTDLYYKYRTEIVRELKENIDPTIHPARKKVNAFYILKNFLNRKGITDVTQCQVHKIIDLALISEDI